MSKNLKFNYQGKDYVLEYTRRTVEMMEKQGFSSEALKDKPMTALPQLFAGAFLANHRYTKQDVINDIYAMMTDKGELIGKLVEMYNEPIAALVEDPAEDAVGKVQWEASW